MVALLNILLCVKQIIHGYAHSYELKDSSSFKVCYIFKTWNDFSLRYIDFHPLKATMINDPLPVTLEQKNDSTNFDLLVLSWPMSLTQFLPNYPTIIWWRKLFLLLNLPSHYTLKQSMPSLSPCESCFIYFQTILLNLLKISIATT